MSRSKATKRRKVWVNHSNDGSEGFHEECASTAEDRCPYPGCPGVKDHVECPKCGADHCDCWGRR